MADNRKNIKFEIPLEGSLGILAIGAVGLKAWRKVIKQAGLNEEKKNVDE